MELESRITSPCTGVCRIDQESGFCAGCLRTIAEIRAWRSMGDKEKLQVLQLLNVRQVSKH
ncbi:hypothetical protein SAMN05192560_0335 [Methylobacillus rhizosphaerae]|uniref:Fe-S protein n=1 Tax=Methylobacillus rhizosphaerae TaxID=551994 RepID=A0A238Y2F2_9PROT|nr:DUF1289 domain-containing protein [Methylobacillus rhizosphaerae]SNR64489.1 hypothetical protein SAMN05192560_0335 [Methylobacillus rhizosphaerae]